MISDSFEDIHKAYLFWLSLNSSNFQARILISDIWWSWEDKPTIGELVRCGNWSAEQFSGAHPGSLADTKRG